MVEDTVEEPAQGRVDLVLELPDQQGTRGGRGAQEVRVGLELRAEERQQEEAIKVHVWREERLLPHPVLQDLPLGLPLRTHSARAAPGAGIRWVRDGKVGVESKNRHAYVGSY